ncbi:MAG: hypothetical protein QGG84_08100, partial [Rhodospirillales bacterium]|nr:hypothetical protein [Rhodospirillales bacterium]
DEKGEITEIRCTYDPATKGGNAPDGRKVKATLHWVSAQHAKSAEVRLYDHLFNQPNPDKEGEFLGNINSDSLEVLEQCALEPSLVDLREDNLLVDETVQFERLGYFCLDKETTEDRLVFNRTLGLRDSWARIQKQKNKNKK